MWARRAGGARAIGIVVTFSVDNSAGSSFAAPAATSSSHRASAAVTEAKLCRAISFASAPSHRASAAVTSSSHRCRSELRRSAARPRIDSRTKVPIQLLACAKLCQ